MRMPIHVHIVMRGLIHVHAHAHAHAYTHVHAHAYTHAIVYACLYMGTEHVRRGWGFGLLLRVLSQERFVFHIYYVCFIYIHAIITYRP